MILRIRFHGRGGQGMKTASRIVGSAAYRAGFQAQDSPVYGAERRGAPIAAYTRISDDSIRERGVIETPDLTLVADASLVADPLAGVLSGTEGASAIFVNTDSVDRVHDAVKIEPQWFTYDVTARTLEEIGHASALSTGMAAAASRLSGLIDEEQLVTATREELIDLDFPEELTDKNVAVARGVFNALSPVEIASHVTPVPDEVFRLPYDGALRGTASIVNAGNAELKKTGNWRLERPVIDRALCTRCGLCVVHCPDGAIALDEEGYPVIDYDHCKGCMICRQICPPNGIETHSEVAS